MKVKCDEGRLLFSQVYWSRTTPHTPPSPTCHTPPTRTVTLPAQTLTAVYKLYSFMTLILQILLILWSVSLSVVEIKKVTLRILWTNIYTEIHVPPPSSTFLHVHPRSYRQTCYFHSHHKNNQRFLRFLPPKVQSSWLTARTSYCRSPNHQDRFNFIWWTSRKYWFVSMFYCKSVCNCIFICI